MSALVKALSLYCLAALLGAYALAFWFDAPKPIVAQTFLILSLTAIVTCVALVFLGYVIRLAAVEREPFPIARIGADCARFLRPSYLIDKLGPLALSFFLLAAFGTYKSLITKIQPFYLDGFLSDLDRSLLGTDAWRLTHAAFGNAGTIIFESAYRLWFAELSLSLIYFSMFAAEDLKRRFFLAFFLLWSVIGFVMATALSSAGPCFLSLIHHPYAGRYADLFPLLRSAPVALAGQHLLAVAYASGEAGAFLGISAMPSMHVAFAALVPLALRPINRMAAAGAWLFYALIVLGSVHLGYHYLSDGIVGTAGALLIWRSLGVAVPARAVSSSGAGRDFASGEVSG